MSAGDADGAVIEVQGELDSGTCDELMKAFSTVADESRTDAVTLDLSQVTFIDSAATRTVIIIDREARERGISLVVAAPPNEVTALLRTAGVIERLQLRPGGPRTPIDSSMLLERVELELPRDAQSPARARAEVRDLMAGRDQTQVADVVLLTSEIVTNAVVHAASAPDSAIGLRILVYSDGLRVEVDDTGVGFDPAEPTRPAPDRGRGLFLVDRFASRWGTEHTHGERGRRFVVWFELDWRRQRKLASPNE